jgi:predicted  nucleic acid-binding Zn-ribbon protein
MDVLNRTGSAMRELRQLEEEERSVSRRRRQLHDKITFIRGGGRGIGPEAEALLFALETEELELSGQRKRLHARIDELRNDVGIEAGPKASSRSRPRIGP